MNKICLAATAALMLPGAVFAQAIPGSDQDAFEKATAVNVCEFGVASASYTADNQITAICLAEGEAVTGFVPLLGGFAPAVFPALAFIIGVAGNGGGGVTNGTSGTTGTN